MCIRDSQLTEQPQKRMSLPLAGLIAAGSPILAVEQDERIDFAELFDNDDHYCLKVKGDSMIEDQIADGDYVIIHKQSTCREGEIVVALVEGQEATLKRFYKITFDANPVAGTRCSRTLDAAFFCARPGCWSIRGIARKRELAGWVRACCDDQC